VGLQEVRWDQGGTVRARDYNFLYGKGSANNELETGFFVGRKGMPGTVIRHKIFCLSVFYLRT
jgi:hypothetical protein